MDRETAGEYALGLLGDAERRDFEQAAAKDAALKRELHGWEAKLASLGLALKPVAPSPFLWLRLQRDLRAGAAPARARPATQAWAALATAASLLLAFGWYREAGQPPVVVTQQAPAPRVYVALLQMPQATMHWTVSMTPDRKELAVRAGGEPPAAAAQFDAELWMITDAGPVSLGIIPKTGELHRVLGELPVASGRTLAVSLEPRGGSPTGQPTGPVVTSSTLLQAS